MIKMLRVLSAPNGHLINVAMKGFGMSAAVALVAFAANHTLHSPETHQGHSTSEWQSGVRQALVACAIADRPATLQLDEYKLLDDQWFTDLGCLLKNNISSETLRKPDLLKIITAIVSEVEKEKRSARLGLSAAEIRKERQADYEAQQARDEEPHHAAAENQLQTKKMLAKHPHKQAEMYKIVLNRIKTRFHLVLQYSPSGGNFRQKICKHKELMYLSQMIFMNDLPKCELEQLGTAYLDTKQAEQADQLLIEHETLPESEQIRLKGEREEANRILACAVGMFTQAQEAAEKYAS